METELFVGLGIITVLIEGSWLDGLLFGMVGNFDAAFGLRFRTVHVFIKQTTEESELDCLATSASFGFVDCGILACARFIVEAACCFLVLQ